MLFPLRILWLSIVLAAAWTRAGADEPLFRRVFGDTATFDLVRHRQVREGDPGRRHYVDRNRDGRAEEVWFIDESPRHPAACRPLLVKVVDEDGDLAVGDEPDLDSDLYVADWKADGVVDAMLDYTDRDGDGDVDEMGLYFVAGTGGFLDQKTLRVWWSRDVGDDNLLWYDVGYTYNQALCQYRTHFGGDELFVAFALSEDSGRWIPFFENPFLFYDHDGDGVTEEVLRVCGIESTVESIRHSFDADGDATRESPRDFDVSVSAWARGAPWTSEGHGRRRGRSSLSFDERFAERTELRGIPTGPFLRWDGARRFAAPIEWERALLTWDEIDHNVDGDRFADTNERWEGVIARGTEGFPQIGGPSAGAFNKRYELDLDPIGPVRVYYHPSDHRLHLRGADRAWMDVDYDLDRESDMRYRLEDVDRDGVIDRWSVDVDADGNVDDSWEASVAGVVHLDWNWPAVNGVMAAAIERAPADLWVLDQSLRRALKSIGDRTEDPLWTFLDAGFERGGSGDTAVDSALRRKLLDSDESLRFYLGLLRDRMLHRLKSRYANAGFWAELDRQRAQGDLGGMAHVVAERFPVAAGGDATRSAYSRWLADRRHRCRDLVVGWGRWPNAEDIAWESEHGVYWIQRGRFGFFAKKTPDRLLRTESGRGVHLEAARAGGLVVAAVPGREGPGCGGLTLYHGGKARPLFDPGPRSDSEGERRPTYTSRLVSDDDEKVTVELEILGVGADHTARIRCSAVAGEQRSVTEVLVSRTDGGKSDGRLELGIGFPRLEEETLVLDSGAGVFGIWGISTPETGRVGLGVTFAPTRFLRVDTLPSEHRVVLELPHGTWAKHYIIGDVLHTRRFNRCPTGADWLEKLRRLRQGDRE